MMETEVCTRRVGVCEEPLTAKNPYCAADESPLSHLEDYRDCYLKKNRRDSSHSDLISMIHDLNQPELRGRVFDMETNGSEIEFQEEVFEKQIDVDNLLTRYSVDHILINRDQRIPKPLSVSRCLEGWSLGDIPLGILTRLGNWFPDNSGGGLVSSTRVASSFVIPYFQKQLGTGKKSLSSHV